MIPEVLHPACPLERRPAIGGRVEAPIYEAVGPLA